MHAGAVVGQVVGVAQAGHHVVGVQHRVLADRAHTIRAVHRDVGEGAHVHAKVSVETLYAANRFGGLGKAVERGGFFVTFFDDGNDRAGEEVDQVFGHADRARARAAAAVRCGERFMQVEVHDIDAQIARAGNAEQGVHVGAVAVDQAARVVHRLHHLQDVLFEQAQRVGVRQHEASQAVIAQGFQRFHIDVAVLVGLYAHNIETGHRRGCRVCAVG